MSKFFKALEQAKRDQGLRGEAPPDRSHPEPFRPSVPDTKATAPARAPQPVTHRPRPPHAQAPQPQPPQRWAPRAPAGSFHGVDEHLVSLVTPAAFEAEQYRALRHIVEQLHRTADLKAIAVSSPAVGDGKTLTALNLAGALAQAADARVLLLDADLRRPSLGRYLGITNPGHPGLVDAILDPGLALDQVVQPRPPFNLSVICAGQTPPSPYEVLKAPRLAVLLDEARHQYDYIIVDTPPLTPVQDCRIIGRYVDGFLLVVTAHRTRRPLMAEALTTLDPAKIIGLVFNQDEQSVARHYSGRYGDPVNGGHPSSAGRGNGTLLRAVKRVGHSFRERAEGGA